MALTLSFTLPVWDFQKFEKKILRQYADSIKKELAQDTPGAAKALWFDQDVDHGVVIRNKTSYLPYVVQGTGLYGPNHTMIVPKKAKALSWLDDSGERVFVAKSRGMRSNPFIQPAVERGMGRVHVNF